VVREAGAQTAGKRNKPGLACECHWVQMTDFGSVVPWLVCIGQNRALKIGDVIRHGRPHVHHHSWGDRLFKAKSQCVCLMENAQTLPQPIIKEDCAKRGGLIGL